ncbi:MAG: hypothetical protein JWN50_38 [Parcubacteria group bacterium]|nr:hypothetical protein [Parcubacteria group bacterium]
MKKLLVLIVIALVLLGGVFTARRAALTQGTDVQTGGIALATTTDSAPSPSNPTSTIPETGQVTLAFGETAAFKGFLIRPVMLVEDSRCPAGVYCIQAGTLRIKVSIETLGASTTVMRLGDSVIVGQNTITFVSSDPIKHGAIEPADYRFTFNVAKSSHGIQ